jgi:hypothetical protein
MKSGKKRKLVILITSLIGSLILLLLTGFILTNYLEHSLSKKLADLNAKSSSITVNLFTQSIHVIDLEWISENDSITNKHHLLKVKSISLNGVSIYQIVINKSIHFSEVIIDSGTLNFDISKDTISKVKSNLVYKEFHIKKILFQDINLHILSDSIESASVKVNGTIGELNIKLDSSTTYSAKTCELVLANIQVSRYNGMYGGAASRVLISTSKQSIEIDSMLLIPNYSKYEFGHQAGEQIARLNLSIPQIVIKGLHFDKLFEKSIIASHIEINSFDLYSFKDKRLPFLRKRIIPLPMESFLKLPWHISFDTTIITNSHITIEEFPEAGITTGFVTFDHVNASFSALNNRIKKDENPYTTLHATGLIMGTGKIIADFQLPLDGKSIYKANGSVSQIPFIQFNSILKTADLRSESGQLNFLTFNFNYDETRSRGNLEIDYEDLRINVLNKNKNSTNTVKTILINAVVKNNINQSKSPIKRLGVIDSERNQQKFIFNFWWLSILDGLKSAMTGKNSEAS